LWFKARSTSSWSPSSRLISNRGRMVIDQSGPRLEAVERVAQAISQRKTRIVDLDLQAYFDNVRHHILLEKVAQRVNDAEVMHLLKLIVKATGKKGVSQGRVLSPLLSNLYLNEVDRMLERAQEVSRKGPCTYLEYARLRRRSGDFGGCLRAT
jgi:retron-type reverse transcriptase